MRYMAAVIFGGGRLDWQLLGQFGVREPTGITITFPFYRHISQHRATKDLAAILLDAGVTWLRPISNGQWQFRSDDFKAGFADFAGEAWLTGNVLLQMDHDVRREKVFDREEDRTFCQFVITPELIEDQMPKRVFLSHKSADKAMVRRYKDALATVGIEAWLDEDAMPAGTVLERGLLAGFKESCAAVFFVTPSYRDDGFLATEIEYAIGEERAKGARFKIITLVIADDAGNTGAVPDLLKRYIWKTATTELVGLTEILRALPIAAGPTLWK